MRPRSSSSSRRAIPIRWQAYAVAALAVVAVLFGGGGAEGPVNNGVIQALAAVLLSLLLASNIRGSWPLPQAAVGAGSVLLALVLIVVLQLVPLPPGVWDSLPGRDLARAALALTGSADEWRPLSLDPEATRRVAATLLLPAAILFGLLGSTRREILLVVTGIVIAAGVSALVGALQLTLGTPGWLTFYDGPNPGTASGVFANPNHHATLLVSATLLLALLIRTAERAPTRASPRGPGGFFHPAWLALPFFIVMILATGSRAGMILLLIAAPGALLISLRGGSPLLWIGAMGAVAMLIGLTVLFSPTGNLLAIGQSFVFSDDGRYALLPDVVYTLQQYWPWGSGLGTFVPVFAPNENLDIAGAGYVNHAHNDFLEWLIETGLPGAIWLLVAVGLLAYRLVTVAINRGQLRQTQFAAVVTGALILLLIGLHGLADYPVRILANTAVAAVAVGLMFAPLTEAPPRPVAVQGSRWPLVAGGLVGLLLAAQVLRIFAAEAAVREDNGGFARWLQPQNGRALATAADEQLKMRNAAAARQLALGALDRTPLNPAAVRIVAMTSDPAAAVAPWKIASAMGWRDGLTQLWAFQQALTNAEHEVAAVRADAFLRTRGSLPQEYLAVVRTAALEPRFRAALVERLKLDPPWRRNFFLVPQGASDQELAGVTNLIEGLAGSTERPTLGEARETITRLLERGNYRKAADLYRAVRRSGGQDAQLLDDGGFDRPVEDYFTDSTPFDWLLGRWTGATTTVEEQDGRVLFVESDGTAARTLLRRYVPLGAGNYRLQYERRGDSESPEAISVVIRCAGGEPLATSPTEPLQGSGFERRQISFGIPPGCPMAELAVIARAVGRPAESQFDNFSLHRVSQ